MIVEADGREALGRAMKSVGPGIALAVHRAFRRRGPILADRYHVRVLWTPREVRAALAYVLLNAWKHARRRPRHAMRLDPASSGRWFDGWRDFEPRPRDGPYVAAAQTWLLTVGWAATDRSRFSASSGTRWETARSVAAAGLLCVEDGLATGDAPVREVRRSRSAMRDARRSLGDRLTPVGTGFVVQGGLFATANHVLQGAAAMAVRRLSKEGVFKNEYELYAIYATDEQHTDRDAYVGGFLPIDHPWCDNEIDVGFG